MNKAQRQARAIKALSVTDTLTEAAEVAGISRRTLYTYMSDPTFKKRLEKAFDSMIIEQTNDLFSQRKEAEKVLSELMCDESPEIRLRAAKAVIENARKREETMIEIFSKWARDDDPFGFSN